MKKTLDDLCEFILESFDLIHEHLYGLCMDNKMYSEYSYEYEPEDDDPSTDIKIEKLALVKGQDFPPFYKLQLTTTIKSSFMIKSNHHKEEIFT